jgi:hypothetical protein
MASLLKYCHGFFGFKSQDIYLIVLAAGEIEDYPQDLICHFYFIVKERSISRQGKYFNSLRSISM